MSIKSISNDPIIVDFIEESKNIIIDLNEALNHAEGGIRLSSHLETYGQMVDRILGGAKTLAMNVDGGHPIIEKIGDYAAICKAVGYKASQIKDNEQFYSVCVALLMDATEVLVEMLDALENGQAIDTKDMISQTLIERLRWASSKFSAEYRESVAVKKVPKMNQDEINILLAKLGIS